MKVEFEIGDNFTDYPDPKIKMESILSGFAKMLLATSDMTLYNIKINSEDAIIY